MRKFLFLLTGVILLLSYAVVHAARSDIPKERNLLEYDMSLPYVDTEYHFAAIECSEDPALMVPPDINGYVLIVKFKLSSQTHDNSPLNRPIKQC